MADLGLVGAFGQDAMAQQVRQHILDQLMAQHQQHQMSVEDQRLEIERQRMAQEVANQSLLRQQQGQAFNETLAEKTGANLGPGQSLISPALAQKFTNTSLAPLVKPDQTLPSTQIAAGGAAPTTEITPGTQVAGTAPTITQKPSVMTGQLRFMGTPASNLAENQRVRLSQLTSSLPANSPERRALEYEQATLKNAPAGIFDKTQSTGTIHDTAKGLVRIGADNSITPLGVQGFHPPPLVIMPTVNGAGDTVKKIVPKVAGAEYIQPSTGASQVKAEDRHRALSSLDLLDKSIENAKSFIGPGAGRISSIEQAIGNPDPAIADLGTKILIAKMQVDAAIGGARAAASPQILARWDNLLTQKMTPEALHATVQAIREIISAGDKPSGAGTTLSAADLIKKYGGQP